MNTLVKLETYGQFIRIRPYDRKHRGNWGFLVDADRLSAHINAGFPYTYTERDGLNFITISSIGENFSIRIDWIQPGYASEFSGYYQDFEVPQELVCRILRREVSFVKHLSNNSRKPTRIVNRANRTLRRIADNPLMLRAFSKAMRDHFNYDGDTVYLYDDGGNSFYFVDECNGRTYMNGGLIPHERLYLGDDGMRHAGVYYSVHT